MAVNKNNTFETFGIAEIKFPLNTRNTLIFERNEASLFRSYPHVEFSTCVTFVIKFFVNVGCLQDIASATKFDEGFLETESLSESQQSSNAREMGKQPARRKSITSQNRLVQTPPWMNVRPCSSDLQKFAEDDSQHDVKLNCSDMVLPVHSQILSARSEVFRAMLQNDMLEKSRGSVDIVDMEYSTLKVFIKYLYSGHLSDTNVETVIQLYEAADKYSVMALKTRCFHFLKENLTEDNACRILVFADVHNDKDFKEYIISYIVKNDIPQKGDEWEAFCEDYPKLALRVMNTMCKFLKFSAK